MNGVRLARNLSAGAVASIAAVASYEHMRQLAADYGQPAVIADLMPISVDGLIIVSTIALADDKRSARTPRQSARLALVVGVVASIAANVLATPGGVVARLISAWPAVALLMVVEVLSRRGKTTPAEHTTPAASAVPAARPTPLHAATTATPAAPPPPAASVAKPARPRSSRRPPSADKVAKAAAKLPGATVAQVAAKAGVSESTARRYLPAAPRPAAGATVASANSPRPASVPARAAA